MKGLPLLSCVAILLLSAPPGSSLECYTCLFPTISPLDCLKFRVPCGPSQQCLTSVTTGYKGSFKVVIRELSCGDPSMCNLYGTRSMLGANFTYHTYCCSTMLCNKSAETVPYTFWGLLMLHALPVLLAAFH